MLSAADARAAETLTVTFTTTPGPAPKYAPRNVVAVWVETASGTFIKTIGRWGTRRQLNMTTWVAAAGVSDSDAIMGATRTSHNGTLTAVWDMTKRGGGVVPDGAYDILFESADRNSGASSNLFSTPFNKDGKPQTINTSGGGFNNVKLVYTGRVGQPDSAVPPPPGDSTVTPGDTSGPPPPTDGPFVPPDQLVGENGSAPHANLPVEGCRCATARDAGSPAASLVVLLVLLALLLSTRYASARRRRCCCRARRSGS